MFYENVYGPSVPEAQTNLGKENLSWAYTRKLRAETKEIKFEFPKTSMQGFVSDVQPFSYSREADPEPQKSFLASIEASKKERESWIRKIDTFNKKFNLKYPELLTAVQLKQDFIQRSVFVLRNLEVIIKQFSRDYAGWIEQSEYFLLLNILVTIGLTVIFSLYLIFKIPFSQYVLRVLWIAPVGMAIVHSYLLIGNNQMGVLLYNICKNGRDHIGSGKINSLGLALVSKSVKPYPNETLALDFQAWDSYSKELNKCLAGASNGVLYRNEILEPVLAAVANKRQVWDNAYDGKSFREFNSNENTLKRMIGKLALEISGRVKMDRISIDYASDGTTSYEYLEKYMMSLTNYESHGVISEKLGRFKNYQHDTSYANCQVSKDTWKFFKKDCLDPKSISGKFVDLAKGPEQNFGKKSCLTFEEID